MYKNYQKEGKWKKTILDIARKAIKDLTRKIWAKVQRRNEDKTGNCQKNILLNIHGGISELRPIQNWIFVLVIFFIIAVFSFFFVVLCFHSWFFLIIAFFIPSSSIYTFHSSLFFSAPLSSFLVFYFRFFGLNSLISVFQFYL